MRSIGLALTVVFASACGLQDLVGITRESAGIVVTQSGDTARIVMPDTVAKSTTFHMQVFTFGGSCIPEASRTDIRQITGGVEVRPFDRERTVGCAGDALLMLITHDVTLSFDTPGRTIVRIFGDRG